MFLGAWVGAPSQCAGIRGRSRKNETANVSSAHGLMMCHDVHSITGFILITINSMTGTKGPPILVAQMFRLEVVDHVVDHVSESAERWS